MGTHFSIDFGYGKSNRWEIDEGLAALRNLHGLAASLRENETPASVVVTDCEGNKIRFHEGTLGIFFWWYGLIDELYIMLQMSRTPLC